MKEPLRVLCAREVQDSIADSVKKLIDDYINKLDPRGKHFRSTQKEIRGKSGAHFIFAGLKSNPDSIKSKEGIDIAWIEEANSVSQNSLDLLIPTLRKEDSEIWATWNPRKEDDPIHSLLAGPDGPPLNSKVVQVNYWNNPWFPKVLRDQMEWQKQRDYNKYLHVWEGQIVKRSKANVFTKYKVEYFETPTGLPCFYGADWGFANDPTVLIKVYVDEPNRKIYIEYEAVKVGCEIEDTPELFTRVPNSLKSHITADSARPETISYMRNKGYKITKAIKGNNSVKEGVAFLQNYEFIIHPRCKNTLEEVEFYSFKLDKHTDKVLPELEDKNNNVIDAMRYALENYRRSLQKKQGHGMNELVVGQG